MPKEVVVVPMIKHRLVSALSLVLSAYVVMSLGCRVDRNVVARAGDYELTVDRFAEVLGSGSIPLRIEIAERFAWTWIQYSLFGQRLAAGDSLLDSVKVLEAMWPDRRDYVVEALVEQMFDERLRIDSATVDSAYAAGDHRMIYQVVVKTAPNLPSGPMAERRSKADAIRARLTSGGSWEEANQQNDDEVTRSTGGRLGVIARGETVPEFEDAAFALAPDEVSQVVQTNYGFHVIWRPPLHEIRNDYAEFLNEWLVNHLRDVYVNELSGKWNMRLVDDASEIVRRVSAQPFRALGARSPELMATYDGGRFTDGDFARWLQGLPAQFHVQIEKEYDDDQMREAARWVVNYQIQYLEAGRLGLELDTEAFDALKRQYEKRLKDLRSALRIDSTLAREPDLDERKRAVQAQIDRYLERRAKRQGTPRIVPPFLAYRLRQDADWIISFPGVERALEQAQAIRAARESAGENRSTNRGAR